ncbi:hypothetical protein SAMN05428988_3713 [Chitinophaga sp. YR573]|uniref:hypothetical protein n=1 Tax=Chitinophaga sp. YR573 TaxID=1881040 RepID=UPI0008AAF96D|nr:hypothetical protein [Chitinophaga sp. YR573]SEW26050.1 hypothetical protein SAMN05428988_3713 [Chitinophaga sp. YR573]
MKRAKILLAAISIFAVVGGAYAFKAQRVGSRIWIRVAGQTTCGLQVDQRSILPAVPNQVPLSTTYVTDIAGICPDKIPYYTAP